MNYFSFHVESLFGLHSQITYLGGGLQATINIGNSNIDQGSQSK